MLVDEYDSVSYRENAKAWMDKARVADFVEIDNGDGYELFEVQGVSNLLRELTLYSQENKKSSVISFEDLWNSNPKFYKTKYEEMI